ncbi:hypothetical protein [Phormidium tenue]|uniref:Uncharacterized protein n=1 Tax=Phormidium tenue NIES-30 TaxID=549789 RepID=A0A1U7JB31_9CYAN|nr:hypothetical protein [Phormidium tenue]MBD2230184.1 hypothetical protein [Phormidium tenue FACHB-1052]OKH50988.1 hypothetical protein NIES30_02645 [Phormidium tenue NIES-30]
MAYPIFSPKPVAVAIAAASLLVLAPAALAQSTATDPSRTPRVDTNEGFGDSDANGGIFGESSSPFDLIHRAVLMNDRSPSDFSRQHRGRISDEALNFRTLQQNALRRQQSQPTQTEATEAVPSETGEE